MEHDTKVDLKQRIVGAIVIISLAIIILPIFLSSQDNSLKDIEINNVPPVPQHFQKTFIEYDKKSKQIAQIPKLPKPIVVPVDEINKKQVAKLKQATQPTKGSTVKITQNINYKNAVKPKNKTINQAYTLQLGSFTQQNNALQLSKKLQAKKFKAYIEKIYLPKGVSYRVRVGPYLKYDQVALIKRKIKRQFKIDGKIVNYK
ncbi:MAG: SPOR domain-containing protein [Pseudomonadota bacterium]